METTQAPPSICTKCDLHRLAKVNCLRGRGPSQCDLMFVGEAPGEEEDLSNRPFSGPAGEVFDRLLVEAGVSRDTVFVTNAAKCRPVDESSFRTDRRGQRHYANLTPTPQQSYTCASSHLEPEIAAVRPKVIVAMGNVACDYLLGRYELMPDGKLRTAAKTGKPAVVRRLPTITDLMFSEHWDERRNAWIVPLFHPSFVMRSHDWFLMTAEVVRKAARIAREGPGKERTTAFLASTFEDAMEVARRVSESQIVAYDHETDGLDPRFGELLNTGFSWREGTGATIRWVNAAGDPLYTPAQRAEIAEALRAGLFQNPAKTLVTYHGAFDHSWTWAKLGYRVTCPEHDVQLVYHTLNSFATYRQQSLEALAWLHTPMADFKAESQPWFSKKDFVGCPPEVMGRRNCSDADATLRLHNALLPRLLASGTAAHYDRVLRRYPQAAALLNHNGASVGLLALREMRDRLVEAISDLGERFRAGTGSPETLPDSKGKPKKYNPASAVHLAWTLHERLGLPVLARTPTGKPKTDEYVLTELAKQNPAVKPLLEYKKWQKLLGTYVLGLRGCALFGNSKKRKPDIWTVEDAAKAGFATDGRVHPTFNMVGTATGRPSVTNPNIANQPRPTEEQKRLGVILRNAFEAPPGHWVLERDESQMELRVLAAVSGDKALAAAVNSPHGVHKMTAAKFYNKPVELVTADEKAPSKTVVFAIVYGGTELTVEEQIPDVLDAEIRRRLGADYEPTQEERWALAKEWIQSWLAQYPRAGAWIEEQKALLRRNGHVVSVFGRVYRFPLVFSSNPRLRAACERAAVNYLIQGPADEVTAAAAVRIMAEMDRLGLKSKWVNFVYDSLAYEVPDAELEAMKELTRVEMERPVPELPINFVTEAKIGRKWEDKSDEDKAPQSAEPDSEDGDADEDAEEQDA